MVALIGGAKVSTKLDLLTFITGKVDVLVIGGAMANTLLFAQGSRGRQVAVRARHGRHGARTSSTRRSKRAATLVLPVDARGRARAQGGRADATRSPSTACRRTRMILDIGPQDGRARSRGRLAACSTLVWNGPVGAFETPPFDAGTTALAKQVATLTRAGQAAQRRRRRRYRGGARRMPASIDDLSYVSTAGGAFLEWLEGRALPGVAALSR